MWLNRSIVSLLILLVSLPVGADSVSISGTVVPISGEGVSRYSLKSGEIALINMQDYDEGVTGFEVNAVCVTGSCTISAYETRVSDAFTTDVRGFDGLLVSSQPLIERNPVAFILARPPGRNGALLLNSSSWGAMKPDPVDLTIKPIRNQAGYLVIVTPRNLEKPLSLTIDDNKAILSSKPYKMAPGTHIIGISGDDFGQKIYKVRVVSGKTVTVEHTGDPGPAPTVIFEAPVGATITLDDKPLSEREKAAGAPIEVTAGRHTAMIKWGDMRVSKDFTAVRGKNYFISLLLDLYVQED